LLENERKSGLTGNNEPDGFIGIELHHYMNVLALRPDAVRRNVSIPHRLINL
jgi:hypothetical protein